jgi:hypothetical protein
MKDGTELRWRWQNSQESQISKLNTGGIENLHSHSLTKEIEFVVNTFPQRKFQAHMTSQDTSVKHSKMTQILHRLFQKMEDTSNSFC